MPLMVALHRFCCRQQLRGRVAVHASRRLLGATTDCRQCRRTAATLAPTYDRAVLNPLHDGMRLWLAAAGCCSGNPLPGTLTPVSAFAPSLSPLDAKSECLQTCVPMSNRRMVHRQRPSHSRQRLPQRVRPSHKCLAKIVASSEQLYATFRAPQQPGVRLRSRA